MQQQLIPEIGLSHEQEQTSQQLPDSADGEQRHTESEERSQKPCPGCHASVKKTGSNNEVVCISCHTKFCWICSIALTDETVRRHFGLLWNASGCGGRQLDIINDERSCFPRLDRACFVAVSIMRSVLFTVSFCVMYPVADLLTHLSDGFGESFEDSFKSTHANATTLFSVILALKLVMWLPEGVLFGFAIALLLRAAIDIARFLSLDDLSSRRINKRQPQYSVHVLSRSSCG